MSLKILPYTERDLYISGFGTDAREPAFSRRTTSGLTVLSRHALLLKDPDEAFADYSLNCPKAPGVYGMLDIKGRVIYVGKSKNLRKRIATYLRSRTLRAKEGRVRHEAHRLLWEELPDELGAFIREIELIDLLKPKLNIRDNPNRRSRAYFCLQRDPAPHFALTRSRPYNALEAAGPIFPSQEVREAAQRLNDLFRLIDCPKAVRLSFQDGEPTSSTAAGCIRGEIGKCSTPCNYGCSREGYEAQAQSARLFFYSTKEANRQLKSRIDIAIATLAFEEAAELERIKRLLASVRRSIDTVSKRRAALSFIYIPRTTSGHHHWYLINRASVEAVVPAPEKKEDFLAVASLIRGCLKTEKGRKSPLRETASAVEAWFGNNPSELLRTRPLEEVLHECALA